MMVFKDLSGHNIYALDRGISVYKLCVKRMIDIIVSLVVSIVILPLLLVVAIAIKLDDGGPVFYLSERIGLNCKKFRMIKLRTMKVGAPDIRNDDNSTYNSKDDYRITRVGKVLRETSLDEIVQVFNVLTGDMSLLGPRAGLWNMLDTYKDDELDKMKVRPGISGYTQAYYRNSLSMREKRLKDAWYANNVSFWLDVNIFFKTILTVLKRDNIYTNDSIDHLKKEHESVKV